MNTIDPCKKHSNFFSELNKRPISNPLSRQFEEIVENSNKSTTPNSFLKAIESKHSLKLSQWVDLFEKIENSNFNKRDFKSHLTALLELLKHEINLNHEKNWIEIMESKALVRKKINELIKLLDVHVISSEVIQEKVLLGLQSVQLREKWGIFKASAWSTIFKWTPEEIEKILISTIETFNKLDQEASLEEKKERVRINLTNLKKAIIELMASDSYTQNFGCSRSFARMMNFLVDNLDLKQRQVDRFCDQEVLVANCEQSLKNEFSIILSRVSGMMLNCKIDDSEYLRTLDSDSLSKKWKLFLSDPIKPIDVTGDEFLKLLDGANQVLTEKKSGPQEGANPIVSLDTQESFHRKLTSWNERIAEFKDSATFQRSFIGRREEIKRGLFILASDLRDNCYLTSRYPTNNRSLCENKIENQIADLLIHLDKAIREEKVQIEFEEKLLKLNLLINWRQFAPSIDSPRISFIDFNRRIRWSVDELLLILEAANQILTRHFICPLQTQEELTVDHLEFPHRFLGVPVWIDAQNMDREQFEKYMRLLLSKYHPDRHNQGEEIFKKITEARNLIVPSK